jgi:hypothetical protein
MTKKRERARNKQGRYVGDDKNTAGLNEAYKYTWWERAKWRVFYDPEASLLVEIKKFFRWIVSPKI